MKKHLLIIFSTILICFAAKAQINKGIILAGGNFGFSTSTHQNNGALSSNSSSVNITPSFAKAYANNRLAGFSLTYSNNNYEDNPLNTNGYGASLFLRQYKLLGNSGFSVFAQENLSINFGENKQYQGDFNGVYILKYQYNISSISLNPGFAYNLTKKVQLEFLLNNLVALGYTHSKTSSIRNGSSSDYSKDNQVYLNSNLNLSQIGDISVGVKFILGKK